MKGRKRKQESRAAELRQRLIVWQQTPEPMRPPLRALARELRTSHALLQHYLINLGKWQAEEDWRCAKEIRARADPCTCLCLALLLGLNLRPPFLGCLGDLRFRCGGHSSRLATCHLEERRSEIREAAATNG